MNIDRQINKRLLLISLMMTGFFLSGCGKKTQEEKVYHIGILSALDLFSDSTEGFRNKMSEFGYVEGKNVFYDVYKTNVPVGNEGVLRKFVEDKVDLIFVFPTEASLEARSVAQGTGIPVVFANAVIEGTNIVKNLKRPGGGVTGVRFPGIEIATKRLELLHEFMPDARRVWLPYLKEYPTMPPQLEALRRTASSLGITLIESPFAGVDEFQVALKGESADIEADAILQVAEPFAAIDYVVEIICQFAAEHQIPVVGAISLPGDCSPMLTYSPDSYEAGELAAWQANKIFNGMPAGTLPVISPELHFVINYKVAQKLGLSVSEGLLSRADKIIR